MLRTINETENAHIRIDTFTLQAISGLIIAHPEWVNSGLRWLEVFDRIDLSEMQARAKFNRDVVAQRDGIATMLYQELSKAFDEDAGPQTVEEGTTCRSTMTCCTGSPATSSFPFRSVVTLSTWVASPPSPCRAPQRAAPGSRP